MSSLRLEEKPVVIDGQVYTLRCNMAVLDSLQEAHGGDFGEVMKLEPRQAAPEILAAMLNDSAEDQGYPVTWTARAVKKRFSYAQLLDLDVLGIFTRGIVPAEGGAEATPDNSGN